MAEKEQTSELLNLHKLLQEALKDEYDLTNKKLAITKGLNSIQSKILKAAKEEDKLKAESLANSTKLKVVEDQILSMLKAQKENRAAHLNYEKEIVKLMKKAAELAVEQDDINKKLAKREMLSAIAFHILNKTGMEQTIKLAKEFNEAWVKGGAWGVVGKSMAYALEVFAKIDDESARFRMTMGITREYMDTIQQDTRDIGFNLAHVGVTFEKVIDAGLALSKILFSTMSATKAMVTDVALISAQLGVSAEASTEFMKSMGIAGKSTASAKADLTFFAAKMTEAAGVPLKEIMEDVSNATKQSYQFIAKSSLALIKASVEAKRMGTNLADSVKTSGALLNFTQNVKDEMEASVLLGHSLNLQKARELAYNRDIKGLNNEILKLMKESNFEQLDPFQQDAVARALGKSAGELAQMAQAARERHDWETSTDPVVKSQLAAYNEMQNMTESIAKDLGASHRQQLMIKQNQAAIASITQSWNAILQRIGEGVLPFIEVTLRKIAEGVGWINKGIGNLNTWATNINKTFGQFTKIAMGALIVIGLLVSTRGLGRLTMWAGGGIGKAIGNLFGGIATGVSKFGGSGVLKGALGIAALGVSLFIFAKALTAFAAVKWAGVWIGLGALVAFGVVAGIMGAFAPEILLGALAIGVLGLALLPFAAAAWIASKALQNLSDVPLLKIALGLTALGFASTFIVAGGIALGLAAPGMIAFSLALRLMASPAERVGKAMMDLGQGLKATAEAMSILQSLSFVGTVMQIRNLSKAVIELSKAINDMPDIKVEKLKSIMLPAQGGGSQGAAAPAGGETGGILGEIRDGIAALRDDMKNGSLTANVYIDSQKLDSAMGRRLAYTGTLA